MTKKSETTAAMPALTKGQQTAKDVAALLRARNPFLWIVTREEARVERLLVEASGSAGYLPFVWDTAAGAASFDGKTKLDDGLVDIGTLLRTIDSTTTERRTWILRDLPPWLEGPAGMLTRRQIRNLARKLPTIPRLASQAMIVITPVAEVPPDLAGHATVIEWPLPDRAEIEAILDAAINGLPEYGTDAEGKPDPTKPIRSKAAPNGTRSAAIDAAVGLTGEEAAACFAKSLVMTLTIDPVAIASEKKRVIARERVLEWFDPLAGGLDAVGGLDVLKSWLMSRASAFSPAARAFGVQSPKGVVVVGVQGCGKSLFAKAAATAWKCPLLRLDMGALKSKFVGDSEANIRKAFKVIEAIGRCVVWIDEIEKAMAGATDGGSDGGVSMDALGAILNWMQERTSEAFVIATANDISKLPPELLRKGRFDDVFFVDLPTEDERAAVLTATLRKFGRADLKLNLKAVAQATEGFIGAEIAELVPEAVLTAFNDNAREIATRDLLDAAKRVVPLTKTAETKITALRKWANENARKATSSTAPASRPVAEIRQLDV